MSIVAAAVGASYGQDKVVRIGFQKYGKLVLLKSKGTLEDKSEGRSATGWCGRSFRPGRRCSKALNVGAIDFGNTGEAPPIFAQAAGAPIQYVAYEPPAPKGEAILVPKDSKLEFGRRSQGQEGRAEQGLQRSLSAGEGAGEGRRQIFRRSSRCSSRRPMPARRSSAARSMPG